MKTIKSSEYTFLWGERHSVLSAECAANNCGAYWFVNSPATDFIIISEKNYLDTYASKSMLDEWRRASQIFLTPRGRARAWRSSQYWQRKYWKLFKKYLRTDFKRLSNKELLFFLKTYRDHLTMLMRLFSLSDDNGLYAVGRVVLSTLKKQNIEHLFPVITTPTVPDLIFQERVELAALSRKKTVTKQALIRHAVKHAWLFFNSYNLNKNIIFLNRRIKDEFDILNKKNKFTLLKKRQSTIFRGINQPQIKPLSLFMQRMGLDRLYLKNCWAGAEFRFLKLFQEIVCRTKVSLSDLMGSYTFFDFENLLLNRQRLSDRVIRRRKKLFAFHKYKSQLQFIEGHDEISRIIRVLGKDFSKKNITKIHGVPATPGRARGRCRLVRSIDIEHMLVDLKRFKKGEILISWMTQPNMVPIVKKAAAIVADEGGMMSHAAIIAREFGIPSVVGTRIATKVLRTGDMVEVDAYKGIVKKISI